MVNMKGINKALSTAQRLAKKSTKVVAAALPIVSIVANGLESHSVFPDRPHDALNEFLSRYDGINRGTGKFESARFMKGTGSLIVTGVAGLLIASLS